MLLLDAAIYFSLALYLDKVLPKPIGKREHWLYCCQKNHTNVCETDNSSPRTLFDPMVIEPPSSNEDVSVRIENLSKRFSTPITSTSTHWGLKNVSLDIYKDQITAILGHNGAGKSTLLRILSGLMTPTFGTAYIHGYDINDAASMDEIRKLIGVCPQDDVFSSDLSVRHHLEFFASVRGVSRLDMRSEIETLLAKLGESLKIKNPISKWFLLQLDPQMMSNNHELAGSTISYQLSENQRHHRMLWPCNLYWAHLNEKLIASAIFR
jgi:ABC-type glutathione transport system ATPase component